MDRSIGLGRSIIGWRYTVTCLAAVITVTIVHRTVRVVIWKREEVGVESKEGRERDRERKNKHNGGQSSISDFGGLHWLLTQGEESLPELMKDTGS